MRLRHCSVYTLATKSTVDRMVDFVASVYDYEA